MAPRKEYSTDLKQRIVELLKDGKTQQEVSKVTGCSQGMISNLWAKYKRTGSVKNGIRSGRPRSTSVNQDKHLITICRKMRKSTSKQMNVEWTKILKTAVCDRTLRNRLHEHGYSFRKVKTKPLLSKKHRRERLRWAKQHRNWTIDVWNTVIFSDESRICVGSGDDVGRFVWRLPSEKFHASCLKSSIKFPQGIMIWGCMSSKGTGKLCILNTTVNANVYCEILEHFLIPTIEEQFDAENIPVIFQDDNARCHRGRAVQAYLRSINVKTMAWPAQSPDMNPIENVWRELKKRVEYMKPTTKDELLAAIQHCWKEIDAEFCQKLVESMPKRITEVIKARGGATKY